MRISGRVNIQNASDGAVPARRLSLQETLNRDRNDEMNLEPFGRTGNVSELQAIRRSLPEQSNRGTYNHSEHIPNNSDSSNNEVLENIEVEELATDDRQRDANFRTPERDPIARERVYANICYAPGRRIGRANGEDEAPRKYWTYQV